MGATKFAGERIAPAVHNGKQALEKRSGLFLRLTKAKKRQGNSKPRRAYRVSDRPTQKIIFPYITEH